MGKSGYAPDFDLDYRRGMVGESLVGTFLEAVGGSTLEVKTDYRAHETGNLYIETNQKLDNGQWVKSGISISKANFYCFAGPTGEGFLTIPTAQLKQILKDTGRFVHMDRSSVSSRDTIGFLIKVEDVINVIFRRGAK